MRRLASGSLFLLGFVVILSGCSGSDSSPTSITPLPAASVGVLTPSAITVPTERPFRFLFIHHSVGEGFLHDGGMWGMLEGLGLEVHDRTYGDDWVGDNTDPDHFPVTFTEYYDDMIHWELPEGEHYDIVAFKSCFPASNIWSGERLEEYRQFYETIRSVTRQHPDILFIPFSTPPLISNETDPEAAARAREFANWLTGEYDDDPNLEAYNLFDVLAGNDPGRYDFNTLREEFRSGPFDSHPNSAANRLVAENFTQWLAALEWPLESSPGPTRR